MDRATKDTALVWRAFKAPLKDDYKDVSGYPERVREKSLRLQETECLY